MFEKSTFQKKLSPSNLADTTLEKILQSRFLKHEGKVCNTYLWGVITRCQLLANAIIGVQRVSTRYYFLIMFVVFEPPEDVHLAPPPRDVKEKFSIS